MPLPAIYFVRALGLWVAVRVALLVVTALAGSPMIDLAPLAAIGMAAIVVTLGHVDIARRRERALLENFGTSRLTLVAWLALPALLAEGAFAAVRQAVA